MLKLYNTLSHQEEVFKPRRGRKVNLFVCGPTTYDYSHIGHARTCIFFDMIAKYLKEKGYKIFYLQNITDIDDKIVARAKEKGISWLKLSRNFEKEYLKDVKALGIRSVNKYARATSHIKEIIKQVKRLLKKGYAYKMSDGIYYDIAKFKEYGKLSRRTAMEAEDAVSRIDEAKEKRNKGDFCLWKLSKEGEPKWKSPFGWGRPGWHIEDTAITEKYFGSQYDIHGGAIELSFPHHEAEIAQMEAMSKKKPLAKYWLHTGLLTIGGKKMAKSLGNFISIQDFLKKYSARILRLFVLKAHYRSPIDYSEKLILQTKKELAKVEEFVEKLQNVSNIPKKQKRQKTHDRRKIVFIENLKKEFDAAIENDFNTPRALAVAFDLINEGNYLMAQNKMTKTRAKEILGFLKKVDKIFGFIFGKKPRIKISRALLNLVKLREKYRQDKNWNKADKIRQKIKKTGWRIDDTPQGPKIKKL